MNKVSNVHEINLLWSKVLNKLNDEINDIHVFQALLEDTYIYDIKGNIINVVVNSKFAQTTLSNQYYDLIVRIIEEVTQTNYDVNFVLEEDIKKSSKLETNDQIPVFFKNSHLSSEMTFDNFVVGKCNREAYQASVIVASNPGQLFNPNPLFLYSESGLGKTHLLHAIGNSIKEKVPNKKVLYIRAEDFFDEYIHIVKGERQDNSMQDFFRSVDVLLIDDIQYFAGKDKSQGLFFTVFSNMIENNRQVVIASDKAPSELQGIENRLVTRFAGGLTVNMIPPDLETSKQIMKLHITSYGVDINRFDEDVFTFFAENFSKSVRELDGAIKRLLFTTINLTPTNHVTLDVAINAVQDSLKVVNAKNKINESRIIDAVGDYFVVSHNQIIGSLRTSQIALARHIAMYLIRDMLNLPFESIGDMFGNRHHTTVMTAVEKVEKMLKTDIDLQTTVRAIKEKLNK